MSKPTFAQVWDRINTHVGQTFHTKTGMEFTYDISGETFFSSRANQRIPKSDFAGAYAIVPIEGPGKINQLSRGPAYVWAVLHDVRISKGQW